ncbi:MAG: hypothetical protein J6C23_08360 [Clostridia bacterium]|nr:hypothetical protein [Clostridia bacterium]
MKKPRVVFPFTEAGMGHIMPLRSLADTFERKYGDKVEIVRSNFFTETNDSRLIALENIMRNFVISQNKNPSFSKASMIAMDFFGTELDSWVCMQAAVPGSNKAALKHMEELDPDMLVTTHWATNYYAENSEKDIITVVYCPDAHFNPLFSYSCDLALISMEGGYEKALQNRRRFNENNLKLVPFCIRNEAFEIPLDKKENRRVLGLNEDKFTIVLAEGGYGIGKMQEICEKIIAKDLPVTLIPCCGKNEELLKHFASLPVGKNTEFKPQGFTESILRYIASADLFCGKSGNIIAEPTFFGVPSFITKHATTIEKEIAQNYVERVKCALNVFDTDEIVGKIETYLTDRTELDMLSQNAIAHHENFGAEKSVDIIFDLLCTRFPHLKEDNAE